MQTMILDHVVEVKGKGVLRLGGGPSTYNKSSPNEYFLLMRKEEEEEEKYERKERVGDKRWIEDGVWFLL